MIVVDTAVWADWFNGTDAPEVDRLDHALERHDAGLVPVILTEVLQGFRADRDFERARALLVQLPVLTLDVEGHAAAARLFRRLRSKGITVRGTTDCIIAQTCMTAGTELLSTDQDFAAIARHAPLRLCAL
ncbi:MAG: PIN domain nuclease [Candidatus Rokubacteria bacterium]|nr:PIN domain nuclease [Candidatus Rokubacteria bacterium]MBI3824385.1 PIN domain nuclease [Candidatus Rokubacteria bacterium]